MSHGRPDAARPTEVDLISAAWDAHWDTFFLFEPATGRAIRWNRAFREVSGYPDDEIAVLPAPRSYYGPEDLARASAFVERLQVTQSSGRIELDLICRDGRKVPTEYSVSVMPDRDGQVRYLVSVGRDVSERRRAEQQLRMHRERLMRFIDSASESFHLVDRELRIIEINERAMTALRSGESGLDRKSDVVGRSLLDIYPFLRGDGGEACFREVFESGEPQQFDAAADHPESGTIYMTVQAFTVGRDLGIIATDISERRRAEEDRLHLERQVQHAQKLESLGVLAGGIAHDFNNLLVGVLGGTDLALKHVAPTSPAYSLLEDVAKAAHRAAELANQMLAYSGKGRFLVQPADLSVLVREMVELVEASVSKKIRVVYDLADDLPAAEVDVTQVRQIVLNLVINAAEAIGDDVGAVTLSTGVESCTRERLARAYLAEEAEPGDYVFLSVRDTGGGIDAAARKRIFDPFFTTKSTGRGLGLAATLGIVRGHGGAILVESDVGRGTSMTVLLPASVRPPRPRRSTSEVATAWRGTGRALLVDDEELVRSIAAAMLERLGFDVLEASDGRESIEVFRRHRDQISLVVLDLAMPEMSGAEVLEELRRLDPQVKVLLSSGFNEQDVTRQFAVEGPAGFIQKPYRLESLRRRVRAILEP